MDLSAAEQTFETWRRRAGIVLAPLLFAITYWLCGSLPPSGRTLSAILSATAVLWVTETLPLPVTALLGAVLCILLGVAPARQVLSYFADPIVFVFIGSFMLAQAMSVHGLDRRIALGFLSMRIIAGRPAMVLAGIGLVTALISMWVSNTATTAMMLPIALGALRAMEPADNSPAARRRPFATGMMLMVAYAASIGGIGTPVGSPPNLIGIGLIEKSTGFRIDFFRWMALCVPLFAVMAVVLFVLLWWLHRDLGPSRTSSRAMADYVKSERSRLGRWSRGEINTLIAFGVAVALWITPGVLALPFAGASGEAAGKWMSARLPESVVALVAACLLFLLPLNLRAGEFTLRWDQAVQIDWGTILLFGGGLALGTLMFETGVAAALGGALTKELGITSLWALTALSIAMGIVLSEATSNTASANMIIPLVIGICQQAHLSPIPPALGACLGASYGFMLPVSTPPNAIVYGSGLVPIPAMVRAGILFDIFGFFIIWIGLRVLCPVLGLM
jgi:sodium-dependent dicarboxylate transporter 2/3/5